MTKTKMISTNYNNTKVQDSTYYKLKISLALTEYIKLSQIYNFPALYIGSDVDLEFPLLLQARKIIMIDPCFKDRELVDQIINKANYYGKQEIAIKTISPDHTHISFKFDFGQGKESVLVDLIASKYEDYDPILPLGYVIEFNGIISHTLHKPNIIKKLKLGGVIINNSESPLRQKGLTLTDIVNYGKDINALEESKGRSIGLNTVRIPGLPFAIYQKTREDKHLLEYAYQAIFN